MPTARFSPLKNRHSTAGRGQLSNEPKKDYFCTTIKFIEKPTQTHWMKHYQKRAMQNNDRPILTTYSLRSLVIAVVCAVVVLVVHKDSLWTTTALLLFLLGPLTVYSFVIVKFYDDHIVIIRPLHVIHVKTTIHYCQIHYMRVPSKYLSMAVMDLLIYFKDQKRPMEIPLPYFSLDQQKLERLIESKGIDFLWD